MSRLRTGRRAMHAIISGCPLPQNGPAKRRATWTGGVAHSFAEADDMDVAFWAASTPAERVRGVTQLIEEVATMAESGESPPRLQRAVGGVRLRRG